MGKIIYESKGRAAEYSKFAFSAFVGCSNSCLYCYLRKGRFAKVLGGDTPTLKKCFRNEEHALEVFEKELTANLPELQKHGLFFSFTTDPMLPETITLTLHAAGLAVLNDIPVKILTKRTDWVGIFIEWYCDDRDMKWRKMYAFGFTLTGHDELEPGASTNAERIEAMRKLHEVGFKTFASIEPIIDLDNSLDMILKTQGFCDLYKVGLMGGKKYSWRDLRGFMLACASMIGRFYFKDSLLKQAGIDRANLPANCVSRDYNLFNN